MRGVVTVATARAHPVTLDGGGPFPAREEVVLVALLLQGLTRAPLIRRWGVAEEADVPADARRLHRLVAEAALEHLRRVEDVDPDVRAAVVQQHESRLGCRRHVDGLVDGDRGGDQAGPQLRDLLAQATEAGREALPLARRRGDVSPAAADDVMSDVEARALRYSSCWLRTTAWPGA